MSRTRAFSLTCWMYKEGNFIISLVDLDQTCIREFIPNVLGKDLIDFPEKRSRFID